MKRKKLRSMLLCCLLAAAVGFPPQCFAIGGDAEVYIRKENGERRGVDGVNEDRGPDSLVVYTCDYGDFTPPFDDNVTELIVVNDVIVEKSEDNVKGTYIPANGYVISASGSAGGFVEGLGSGDAAVLENLELPFFAPMYFEVEGLNIQIDTINASVRNAGEVVLYNSSFPAEYTGTNPYGIEFTVIDGKVTEVHCLDYSNWNGSLITENGLIISMHMDNANFEALRNAVVVGSEVNIVLDNIPMYGAGKTGYNAFNPRSREDNPEGWPEENPEPYPGFRGVDQLIVYDDSYGETTGTNPYGYEVAVDEKGIIIEADANASKIPQGGYVLSGHGVQAAFLTANARIGSSVVLNTEDKSAVILYTPGSYAEEARRSVENVEEVLRKAEAEFRDIDGAGVREKIGGAREKLGVLEDQLDAKEFKPAIITGKEISEDARTAFFRTFQSRKVETRAVWLRPKEDNIDKVRKVLDDLKSINVNTLYVELDYDGYIIFKSDNEYFETNPVFEDFDVLAAYIEEGGKRGIEVHAWSKTLCVLQRVADKIPDEWLMRNRDGEAVVVLPWHRFYFFNPGHPDGTRFLLDLYKEVVRNYDIKGIQVDYVRYPEADYGYDEYTRNLFINEKGVDPITLSEDSPLYKDWCQFRIELVNKFVYRFAAEMKSVKPEIEFSAAVWPNRPIALDTHFQDSKDWIVKDYLDNTSLMSYNPGLYYCVHDTATYKEFGDGHSIITLGMGAYIQLTSETIVQQVNLSRDAGAGGVAIFDYESLFLEEYDKALKEGVYKAEAVSPVLNIDLAIETILEGIKDKTDRIYVPGDGMTAVRARTLKASVNNLLATIPEDGITEKNVKIVIGRVEGFKNMVIAASGMDENVKARITADIDGALDALKVIQARGRFMEAHVVDRFELDIPEIFTSGQEFEVKVKAVFSDKKLEPVYLDSQQLEVAVHDPNIHVNGAKIAITGDTKARAEVRILDAFKLDCKKGIEKQLSFLIETEGYDQ